MKAIRLALLEFCRFRGPGFRRRLLPLAIILVPALLGSLHLWANWDPFGRIDELPVAVVNSDRPINTAGHRIDAGEQFTQQLKATDIFDWHFVNHPEARQGLSEGRYYAMIEVPGNFSAKLATATRTTPQRAALLITKNDANGYLAGIMTDTAKAELHNQINAAAHATYAKALYTELDKVRDALRSAAEASNQLIDRTELHRQGLSAMGTGLAGVHGGTNQSTQGIHQVARASAQLDRHFAMITDFTAQHLPATVNTLVNTSNTALTSLSAIQTNTASVYERATDNVSTMEELGQKHPALRADPTYQRALSNAQQLATATATATDNAERALNTAQDANQRAIALQTNLGPMQSRIQAINVPLDTLRTGSAQASAGNGETTRGLGTLSAGARVSHMGADQLHNRALQLAALIDTGARKIPAKNPTQVEHAAEVLGSPTEINTTNLNPAYVYGRGLAPLLFSVALWIFGFVAYQVLAPVNPRAVASRTNAFTIAVAGWLPAAVLGVLGGLAMVGIVQLGLALNPLHWGWLLGLVPLAAVTFVAIDHFLRTAFRTVGRALSAVVLVVQITACGGLFPLETMPVAFRAVNPYIPMTYLVDGLRVAISGGLTEKFLFDLGVLGGVLLLFLILTTFVVRWQRTWTVPRLRQ